MDQDVLRQVNTNEHHLADALFTLGPIGAEVAAHQLVHTLEDHLLFGALHIEHAFVAQHLGAVDVDDGAKEVFQLGRIELALGFVDKALHVVIVVVLVAWAVIMLMRV